MLQEIPEDVLRYANNNVRSTFDELRKKIIDMPDVIETVENRNIVYQLSREKEEKAEKVEKIDKDEKFCMLKIRKDYLEIDFKADKYTEDPIRFSWKIRQTRNSKFDRRMQLKNNNNINLAFELIFQAYNIVKDRNN